MYIIDVEYSEYETALTNERQKFGFATSTIAQGLTIASALTTPLRSAQLVAGVASGVAASRGYYDSEIVIAKTIQIAQGHMRAQRDIVAKRILPMRLAAATVYPLSAALRDLEDYYLAGTLTTGLVEALGKSGDAAQNAAEQKALVITGVYSPDQSSRRLDAFLRPDGNAVNRANLKLANECLRRIPGAPATSIREILGNTAFVTTRLHVISCLGL